VPSEQLERNFEYVNQSPAHPELVEGYWRDRRGWCFDKLSTSGSVQDFGTIL
jgi:hypothetical protein